MPDKLEEQLAIRTGIITTNLDGASAEEQEKALRAMTESSGIPVHKGVVDHAYGLDRVADSSKCPRCSAPTENRYADFIYAAQKGARIMMAPAGYFCTRCPTVIVNEDLLRRGVSGGHVYRSVLGIEPDSKLFRTWNGEETILVLDEMEETMDLVQRSLVAASSRLPAASSKKNLKKAARRKELAKASRKRNRR